jgi:hypothetical protein
MDNRLGRLDLGIEIEERLQTGTKLLLDLLFTALEDVHGDVRLSSICEFHWSLADLDHVFGGKQPHAVDQRQIRHTLILRRSRVAFATMLRFLKFRIRGALI